eukprot:m.197140 g.197140  ORF g.197140 m.197140 type:complete len:365 (+) comp17022_c0_seq15:52-1146(+)
MSQKPSAASLVDLKAELARKQAEYRQEKLNPSLKDERVERERARHAATWLKANKGVMKRSQQDMIQSANDTKTLLRAEAALKAKGALYEKLRQGQLSDIEQERYLVDFEQKFFNLRYRETEAERDRRENPESAPPVEVPEDDVWVDFVDEFGRNRRCLRRDLPKHNPAPTKPATTIVQGFVSGGSMPSTDTAATHLQSDDMRRDQARQDWEDREKEALANSHHGPVHYETVRAQEVRNLGTAYFQFSADADQREAQMATLNSLRDKTQSGRDKAQRLKARRAQARQDRLDKIRRKKGGLFCSDIAWPLITRGVGLPVTESKSQPSVSTPAEDEDDLDSFLEHVKQHSASAKDTAGETASKASKH